MKIIKEMFSTTKRAIASIITILLIGILAGTAITFAAVWNDVKADKVEEPATQILIGSEEEAPAQAQEAPAQQAPAVEEPAAEAPAPLNDAATHQKISQKQAEDIALKDAGISRSSADNIFSHYEYDDGAYQYEVQIYEDLYEYEYNIAADTGYIIEKDIDYIYD